MNAPEVTVRLFMDGNEWCALIGEDLQEGVAGFGDTPDEALRQLSEAVYEELHTDWAAKTFGL